MIVQNCQKCQAQNNRMLQINCKHFLLPFPEAVFLDVTVVVVAPLPPVVSEAGIRMTIFCGEVNISQVPDDFTHADKCSLKTAKSLATICPIG